MFGLFTIEAGSEPVPFCTIDGKPWVFETGAQAAAQAKEIGEGDCWVNGYHAQKVQPRRLASDAWKQRELGRFADGTYVALPWADRLPSVTLTADHFAHISTEDGAKVAYTQDAAKGAGDIQTRVKPGRYLAQFYSDVFDAPTIARMAAEFDNQYGEKNELLFASTADDIERVYTDGPSSCMSHSAGRYSSSVHPVRVYAAGDLQVAYLERNGSITARVLVWPTNKVHSSIYGDHTRLAALLEVHGYTEGAMTGARLLRIADRRDCFVMPYIDNEDDCTDHKTHLVIGGRGSISCRNTNGLSGSPMSCCNCDTEINEDDYQSDDNGNYYCDDCFNERFGYCERTEETCDRDTMSEVIVSNGRGGMTTQHWSERAVDQYAFECAGNNQVYNHEFQVELADGTVWSQAYFEDNGAICEGTSECYSHDDCVQLEDGTTWSKDYFSDNGVTVNGKLYDKSDAPQDDMTETKEAFVRKYRASPTFHCPAQIEMPLPPALHLERGAYDAREVA